MMKTNRLATRPLCWQEWAARQLGTAPDAAPEGARTALMRRLPQADFVPPSSWKAAWQILAGQLESPPLDTRAEDETLHDQESQGRDQVQAFADEFWSLDIPERRRRWRDLRDRWDFSPPLRFRLQRLADGLRIGPITGDLDRPLTEMIGHIQQLFILRPVERGASRQALRAHLSPPRWEEAARLLQDRYPDIAALEEDLVHSLISWRIRKKQIAKMRRRLEAKRKASARQGSSGVPRWVIIIVVITLVRMAAMLFRNSDSSRTTQSPQFTPKQDERIQKIIDNMQKQKNKTTRPGS